MALGRAEGGVMGQVEGVGVHPASHGMGSHSTAEELVFEAAQDGTFEQHPTGESTAIM